MFSEDGFHVRQCQNASVPSGKKVPVSKALNHILNAWLKHSKPKQNGAESIQKI